ncbi:MAG TPA: OmpA family protein [Burkholderiaceae bacterium]|nr:OmpA family protein [Burkholderiaceae bacterium]
MSSFHPARQFWLASVAAATLCGCSLLPHRAPPPAPAGGAVASPPAAPEAATPTPSEGNSGGLLGAIGSMFGGSPPDPNTQPEAFASYQLEEMAHAMDEDLRGTPVEVSRTEANVLRVAVPANYCFDAGRSAVKQPLAAVLDRMAAQLKQKTTLQVVVVGPSDAGDSNALRALDRAAAARDYLIARGVPAARFSVLNQSSTGGLELRVAARKGLRGGIAEPARAPAPRQEAATLPAGR